MKPIRTGEDRTRDQPMSTDGNKQTCRRFIEDVWNRGQLTTLDEIIHPDHVSHDPAASWTKAGIDGVREFVTTYRTAFPDTHIAIEDMMADGDRVTVRWVATGTNTGPLIGMAPTGKSVRVTGIQIDRLSQGMVVETWMNWDTLGMLQQLGVAQPVTEVASR